MIETLLAYFMMALVMPVLVTVIYRCSWPLVVIVVMVSFVTPLVWLFTGLSAEPTDWWLVYQGTGVFGLLCIVAYACFRNHTPKKRSE